jgi:ABC-2 type transport system permease protein
MMLATYSLWLRDVLRFVRQPSRVVGALLTPVIFWFVIGSGLGTSFQGNPAGVPSQAAAGFLPYYFPGSLALIVLFTAIFSTISIIEDRQEGFLQGVLASPAPRAAIVLGKALGSTTLAVLNGLVFLLLLPFSGLHPGAAGVAAAVGCVALLGLALSGLGIMIAWPLRSTQGFHAIMNVALVPMWLLSGALFPASGASGWVQSLMRLNPLTPAVEMIRAFLTGVPVANFAAAAGSVLLFAVVTLSISTLLVSRPART